jgi:hypothetical protein
MAFEFVERTSGIEVKLGFVKIVIASKAFSNVSWYR